MADVKHTPGPFCVESATSAYLLDVCLDYEVPGAGCPVLVAHCFHDEDDDCVSPKPISVREAKANARLFAAAPDLLAACKAAKTELAYLIEQVGARPGGSVHVAFDKCLAAITKAEGDE